MRQWIYFLLEPSWGLNEVVYVKWLTQFQHTELTEHQLHEYLCSSTSFLSETKREHSGVSLVGSVQPQKSKCRIGSRTSEMTVLGRGCHRWILQPFKSIIQYPQIDYQPVSLLALRWFCIGHGRFPHFFFFFFNLLIYFGCAGLGCSMWELLVAVCGLLSCSMHVGSSSLARNRTWAPCIGSMESYPLDHQGSPVFPTLWCS